MKKKVVTILLVIIVTILCIWSGMRTRYNNRLLVTQLAGEGIGYVLKTAKNNLLIIDGGTATDSQRLEEIIKENGNGTVMAWFLTSPEPENSGALLEILNHNSDLSIKQIYISFDSKQWYQNAGLEQSELNHINTLIDTLYADSNREKVVELQKRTAYSFDNYLITPLEVAEETYTSYDIASQKVVLEVDTTFKNMLFLGNIGEERSYFFRENNQDKFGADAIQIASDISDEVGRNLFEVMHPDYVIVPNHQVPTYVQAKNVYTSQQGEVTLEIW